MSRKIARGRRRVNHYYFYIKDPQFGAGNSIRISSYAPFPVTVCFNGHHFVAQQLTNRGVPFQTRDNLFVEVGDNKVFECEDNHLIVLWRNARRDLGHGTKLSLARELVRLIAESYAASLAGASQRDSAQA